MNAVFKDENILKSFRKRGVRNIGCIIEISHQITTTEMKVLSLIIFNIDLCVNTSSMNQSIST